MSYGFLIAGVFFFMVAIFLWKKTKLGLLVAGPLMFMGYIFICIGLIFGSSFSNVEDEEEHPQ